MDCQRNIDNGVIPGEICKDEDLWFKNWQLKSDFGIHHSTAKKLVREGKLKVRELKDKEGEIYFKVYFVRENTDFLNTHPQNNVHKRKWHYVDENGEIIWL